ncbi:DUF3291 domain-containing protein [Sinorhizobium sp. BG8]|uniref:DUF3291 domain-containing protein n=1 Tax=Sinorhizobium sp. BG8 TaxID=2613773 RepID=UPI00193DC12E|nr:DUF3291 domain-containing protein [Sinorhizobium sp. BG8]QRM56758.1 DUF3291 domain-containing protein [Sinorhizobium sp. BG8]
MYNFGLHVDDYESPAVEGFRLREAANFEAASRASGFVARSAYPDEQDLECWGPQQFPRFLEGSGFESGPSSLSLWTDIESLMAFSYNGVHADALKHARKWNRKQAWPPLVLWWVPEGERPTWAEGAGRLEHLHDHGASSRAFTFKLPFDRTGSPYSVDRTAMREKVLANRPGQADLLSHVRALKA